ncbi:MAG: PEP-CTERM sorting domain-containing protein [Gemmataceae bacterium]|nr:PEP-CTERM sorting domain-containing protein [Gemmataceae bacterium]MCI0741271.1 PEP-CTERM sorting domain-containing protein [Gemmataceae bacterium]
MQRSLVSFIAVAIASLSFAAGARAEDFPWSYKGDGTEIFNNNNDAKSSSISFTGSSGGATGDSGIVIFNLASFSTAELSAPDSFTTVPYGLTLTLGDTKSLGSDKTSGTLTFSGEFSATKVSKDSFLSPVNTFTSPTLQSLVLGSDAEGFRKYSVEILSFTPPGKPGSGVGSIYAEVRINPAEGPGGGTGEPPPPPTNHTPEPSTLILAGLGLPILGLVWRRRQKKTQED